MAREEARLEQRRPGISHRFHGYRQEQDRSPAGLQDATDLHRHRSDDRDEGEESCRALERECVVEAASREAVIALGGGAIAQEENLKAIGDADGVLICLEADVDTILKRVSRRDTRPLLSGLSREEKREKIGTMLAERAPYYGRAHITVRSTDDRQPDDTVSELMELMRRRAEC